MLGLRSPRRRRFWNEDLARFIGTHRACGDALDVSKLGQSVQIRCKGCGETIVRGGPLPPALSAATLSANRGAPAGRRPSAEALRPPPDRPRLALSRPLLPDWWRTAMILLAVIGAGAFALAVLTGGGGGGGAAPDKAIEGSALPAAAAEPPASQSEPKPDAAAASAKRVRPGDAPFTAPLPKGWRQSFDGDAITFVPHAGGAAVAIYFERDASLSLGRMGAAASALLEDREPGAKVSRPAAASLGGREAISVSARSGDREAEALVAAVHGVRYLVLKTVSDGANPRTRAAAQQLIEGLKLGG